ncbi:MAG: hypothetical protein K1X72_21865 [Pyrinomonadaceae bacterium]|nr:hypothetical protein [Pyrinomonadaceae bacterium]
MSRLSSMLKGFVLVSFSMILTGMININAQTVSTLAKYSEQITGIAADSSGNIYFSDLVNSKIKKVTPAGVVSDYAGRGSDGTPDIYDGIGQVAKFSTPRQMAADKSGNIYVIDQNGDSIRKIDNTANKNVTTVAKSAKPGDFLFKALATDPSGNLFYFYQRQLYKVTPGGKPTVVCGVYQIEQQAIIADGTGLTTAKFTTVNSMTIDSKGNIFIEDNGKLRKITPDYKVTTLADIASCGLAVDWAGFVYTSNCNGNTIYKWSFIDNKTTKYAGTGAKGTTDGPAASALFNGPEQIVISGTSLYVADRWNQSIRRIKP